MTHHDDHAVHPAHEHAHDDGCAHLAVRHADHVDFLHDGHLHHPHADHVDEHVLEVGEAHPSDCTPRHACPDHGAEHQHGEGCGHEPVPHGEHVDFLVDGHLHRPHTDHCDHHGALVVA